MSSVRKEGGRLWCVMTINLNILNNLEKTVLELKETINKSIQESVNKNKDVLKQMQTDRQMFQGINSEGNSIRPFYAGSTIRIKLKKRPPQPVDRVTLKDSLDFYSSINIKANKDDFIISTEISYSIYLVAKYSKILGITKENLTEFIDNYTIEVIKKNFNDIIAKS